MQKIHRVFLYCAILLLPTPYPFILSLPKDTDNHKNVPAAISSNTKPEAPRSSIAHIIFDLGGVLIDTKKLSLLWELGPKKLALYWFFTHKSPQALKQTLYTLMNSIERRYNRTPQAYDAEGLPLPSIMHNWLSGKQTNKEILIKLTHSITQHPEWFINHTEQALIQKLVTILFTPEHFIATRTFIPQGITLVKSCKERGFKVYILSNWDAESFSLLRAQNPSIFNLFDGTIISGDHNYLKPDMALYSTLLNTFNLHPHDCVMIDDRIENILSARTLGIHGIHYTSSGKHDFSATEKEIVAWARYMKKIA